MAVSTFSLFSAGPDQKRAASRIVSTISVQNDRIAHLQATRLPPSLRRPHSSCLRTISLSRPMEKSAVVNICTAISSDDKIAEDVSGRVP